jgi:hypothetical protein
MSDLNNSQNNTDNNPNNEMPNTEPNNDLSSTEPNNKIPSTEPNKIKEMDNKSENVSSVDCKKQPDLLGCSVDVPVKHINEIVDTILDVLDGRKLSPVSIIRVVATCMKVAAKMKVSNHNKKKIVLAGLEKFIKEKSGLSDVEIDIIMAVVDSVVSDAIDTIVDVSNGKLNLQKKLCFCC